MHGRGRPFAGLGVCMIGNYSVENAVCNTGKSGGHTCAVCMTVKHLLAMLCAFWGIPYAGLDVCMTGKRLWEDVVCPTGNSAKHTSDVCMTGKHLLEMLCA